MQPKFSYPKNTGGRSSFEGLSGEEIEAHLNIRKYGDFELTDAVQPSYDLAVVPKEGFRHDAYRDAETGIRIPVIMAAASCRKLFEVFMDTLDPLGEEVDVALETSHGKQELGHKDLYRENIDLSVLKSTLYDFEKMLLNDGCTGVAVLNPHIPLEVQLDEHKLIIIYAQEEHLKDFEEILRQHRIRVDENMKFITEAEHVHSSSDEYVRQFEQLQYRLGLDDE